MTPVLMALALAGCSNAPSDLVMTDRNNFAIEDADMTLGRVQVGEGADFCVDWSTMTTDIRGRPLDPAGIEQVLLVDFSIVEDELVSQIVVDNSVPQEAATPYIFDNPNGRTEACASEFGALGNPFDLEDLEAGPERTWLLSLTTLPGGITEVQQVMVVEPIPGEANAQATFADGISSITIEPDLGSPPLETQAGASRYTLDWSGLRKDVNGRPWDNLVGDQLFIVHYDGAIDDAEEDFLLLDYNAAELYELVVRGKTDADLSDAEDAQGTPFPGFTADGRWLVGITCSECISPVPLAIAVVKVAPK